MSYVSAKDFGCGSQPDPWVFFSEDLTTRFNNPNSIATSGKTSNIATGGATNVLSGFFVDYVAKNGLDQLAYSNLMKLSSNSYPNGWAPIKFRITHHKSANNDLVNHSVFQQYLNNCMLHIFFNWNPSDLAFTPLNHNIAGSLLVPIFTNLNAYPIGIKNIKYLLTSNQTKYTTLLSQVFSEALAAKNKHGVCERPLRYIVNTLNRIDPTWTIKYPNCILAKWYNYAKN